jgi:hypothetical protein
MQYIGTLQLTEYESFGRRACFIDVGTGNMGSRYDSHVTLVPIMLLQTIVGRAMYIKERSVKMITVVMAVDLDWRSLSLV